MEVFKVSCSLKGQEDTPDVFLLFAQFFQLFPVRLLNWTLREVKWRHGGYILQFLNLTVKSHNPAWLHAGE